MQDSDGNKYILKQENKGQLLKAIEDLIMPDDLIATYEKGYADGKAKREWVGLTDEDIEEICWTEVDNRLASFAYSVEANLKEKNHG
jgi:hypothetical protein